MFCVGRLHALSENVSADCGICAGARSCGGKGTGASFILVSWDEVNQGRGRSKVIPCYAGLHSEQIIRGFFVDPN